MRRWQRKLHGSLPALVTPFRNEAIDEAAFAALVERQVARGSAGLVVAGTTGEAPSLLAAEYVRLIDIALQASRRRVSVIAGVGAPNTAQAIELARLAERAGANLLLCGMPAYVKPTQQGLYLHVKSIHDATGLPIILYDVPSRCGVALTDDTIARLAELPRVAGLKDATADLRRPARLRRQVGEQFLQFSGDDATALDHRLAGGHGCISVTANVAPALCASLHALFDAGNLDAVRRVNDRLQPLHEALFLESNPIPVKRALHRLGFCADELRLPLTPLGPAADAVLASVLEVVWAAEETLARKAAVAVAE